MQKPTREAKDHVYILEVSTTGRENELGLGHEVPKIQAQISS